MTLQEMQAAKRQTEAEIQRALTEFMRKTGLAVRSVDFSLVECGAMGGGRSYVPGEVRLDVRM